MAARVPSQSSTKWWVLLAVIGATFCTWWQASHMERDAPRSARPPATDPDVVEVDVQFEAAPPASAATATPSDD